MKLRRYDSFLRQESINENLEKSKKFMKDNYILSTAVNTVGLENLLGKDKADQIKYDMQEGNKKSLSPSDFAGIDTDKKKLLTDEMRAVVCVMSILNWASCKRDLKRKGSSLSEIPNIQNKEKELMK